MTAHTRQDITRDFIRSKRPCTDGYRWYLKRQERLSDYQALLDDLVAAGRLDDACWLLDQLGPTDDVLQLDELDAPALVFAGSVECRGSLEVDTVLRTGRSLNTIGGVRAGTLHVGEDLRVGWEAEVEGDLRVGGRIHVGHGIVVAGQLACQGGVRTGDDMTVAGGLDVALGVETAGSVRTQGHLQCGMGMVAEMDIRAGGAIRVGESLQAGGLISAGPDYGVFAGLVSPMGAWESCGWVRAREKPERLLSGWWAGA